MLREIYTHRNKHKSSPLFVLGDKHRRLASLSTIDTKRQREAREEEEVQQEGFAAVGNAAKVEAMGSVYRAGDNAKREGDDKDGSSGEEKKLLFPKTNALFGKLKGSLGSGSGSSSGGKFKVGSFA